jgi:hypothetical protein
VCTGKLAPRQASAVGAALASRTTPPRADWLPPDWGTRPPLAPPPARPLPARPVSRRPRWWCVRSQHAVSPSACSSRIVGFEVEPLSVKHQYKGKFTTDMQQLSLLTVPVGPDLPPQPVTPPKAGENFEIIYTYDVKWEYSATKWASRWDLYLYMGDDQIHWFSIINSLAIVLLLTGIVAMIMMRTLRRDFNRCGHHAHVHDSAHAPARGWQRRAHADTRMPARVREKDAAAPSPGGRDPGRRRSYVIA